jgi:hypothetical protein
MYHTEGTAKVKEVEGNKDNKECRRFVDRGPKKGETTCGRYHPGSLRLRVVLSP